MLVLKRIALAITGYVCAVLAHIITVFILLFVLSMIVTNPASWSIMPFVAVSFYVMPFLLVAAFLFALQACVWPQLANCCQSAPDCTIGPQQ